MCVKKFIFSKFAGLQAYSRQLYYQMDSFTGIFWHHFKLPHAPSMYWLEPPIKFEEPTPTPNPMEGGGHSPPHVLNTCGKPCIKHCIHTINVAMNSW